MFFGLFYSWRTSAHAGERFVRPRLIHDKMSSTGRAPSEFSGMFTILLIFALDDANGPAHHIRGGIPVCNGASTVSLIPQWRMNALDSKEG